MLRIQRTTDRALIVLTVSGRLDAENVSELLRVARRDPGRRSRRAGPCGPGPRGSRGRPSVCGSSKPASASCFATVRRTSGSGWQPRTFSEGNVMPSSSPPADLTHIADGRPKIQRLAAGGTSETPRWRRLSNACAEALAKSRSTSRLPEVRFAGPRQLPKRRAIARAVDD